MTAVSPAQKKTFNHLPNSSFSLRVGEKRNPMAQQVNFPLKKQKVGWNSLFSSQTTDEGTASSNFHSPSSPTESQPTDYQESDEQFSHEFSTMSNNNGHSSQSLNNPKTNSPSKSLNGHNNNNNNNNVAPRQTFNNNNANMIMNNQNQLNNNPNGIPFKSSSQPTTPIKDNSQQRTNFRQLTPNSSSSSSPSANNNIIDNATESEFFKETIRRLLQSNEVEKSNREGEIVFLRSLITSKEAEKNQLALDFKLRENEFKQTISQLQEENTKLKEETFEQFLINAKQTVGLDTSSILDAFHSKFKKPDHNPNNSLNNIHNNNNNNASIGSGSSSKVDQLKIKELTNLLEKERNQHKEHLIKKEEAIAELMKEKQSLTSKIEELNSTCQMERRKTKVFEERSKKYEQKIENLKQIAVELRSHLLSKQSENTSLKNELEELNANQINNHISKNNDPMEEEVHNATQEIIVHSPELPSQVVLENTLLSTQPDPNSDDLRSSPPIDMNNNEFSSSPVLVDPAGLASNN